MSRTLKDVKVGDKVILEYQRYSSSPWEKPQVRTVTKVSGSGRVFLCAPDSPFFTDWRYGYSPDTGQVPYAGRGIRMRVPHDGEVEELEEAERLEEALQKADAGARRLHTRRHEAAQAMESLLERWLRAHEESIYPPELVNATQTILEAIKVDPTPTE